MYIEHMYADPVALVRSIKAEVDIYMYMPQKWLVQFNHVVVCASNLSLDHHMYEPVIHMKKWIYKNYKFLHVALEM